MTMRTLLASACQRSPRALALREGPLSFTYEALAEEVDRRVNAWDLVSLGPGQRLAIRGGTLLAQALALHACWRVGLVPLPVHSRLSAIECAGILDRLRPAALLDLDRNPIALERRETVNPAQSGEAAVLLTSGSAGFPKAVPITEAMLDAHVTASARRLGEEPEDAWLAPLPLAHVGGLTVLVRMARAGGAAILAGRFDELQILAELERSTLVSLVPTMLHRLFRFDAEWGAKRCPRLRAILLGGAPAPPALHEEARRRGLPVLSTYGMTETCSQIATVPREEARAGVIAARPLEGFALRITDADACGEGRIEVRGPAVFAGYLTCEGVDRGSFDGEWFRTGDLGRLDAEGRLIVTGRADEVLITGGENVHPSEVERVLATHPGVRDVAVGGRPDAEWGQRLVALVVRDARVTSEALEQWCRASLAGFKIPRIWRSVSEIPRTASGKIRREEVDRLCREDD